MADLFGDGTRLRSWDFAGPVAQAYEYSRAPISMIVGPTGGGKSTASARRCLRVATWQSPSPRDGERKARIVCICPTYRRAWDTVIPSYRKVFPDGEFKGSKGDPADHLVKMRLRVGGVETVARLEVLFRAVNDLDIEDFFRGFEFTGFWLPEADTNKDLAAILSLGSNRAGRYPEPDDRPDGLEVAAWAGGFGDANAPMIGTHFHDRFYLQKAEHPKDRLFVQPGGFSPQAENMRNLRKINPKYYEHMAGELDQYDVRRLIDNRPGFGRHGQPVHPNFDADTHVAKRSLDVDRFSPVYIGVDCGSNSLIPGVTFSQRSYSGQWRTLAEIYLREGQMNTSELAHAIRQTLNTRFASLGRDAGALLCLDPAAGGGNAASNYSTAIALQNETQIETQLAPSNSPIHRRAAVDRLFKRFVGPKEPAKLIDPACVGLIGGYTGGFHYAKRGQAVGVIPVKNRFSHVVEADEYAALTIEGVDPTEGGFIRPEGERGNITPQIIYAD